MRLRKLTFWVNKLLKLKTYKTYISYQRYQNLFLHSFCDIFFYLISNVSLNQQIINFYNLWQRDCTHLWPSKSKETLWRLALSPLLPLFEYNTTTIMVKCWAP